MADNNINEIVDIDPYIDAFTFFYKEGTFLSCFNEIKNKSTNLINSTIFGKNVFLKDFIKKFKINFIKENQNDTNEKKIEKQKFKSSPNKAFNFLLDHFHCLFKNKQNNNEENEIQSAEINRETALGLFMNFRIKDQSYISQNFYGIKSIEKHCPECKMTH